ncbi:peptidoglycan-binding domain-containing protein [Streptacidiphilus melanogenes]|uniref:peptidoglycan-binding domain-containing protein n=1 Tax=Streptacidiphilus melanogenes TaxID=411235 RepID=UPI0005A7DC2C|nr:peptidoglycan-binding protein [Streptacidiphilus melanogenes]
MLKNLGSKAGVAAAAAVMAVMGLAGTANAQPGVGYIGYHQANNPHAVWCVQHMYNYFVTVNDPGAHPTIAEDGVFGPATDDAIRFVQKQWYPSEVDGIVGPATGDMLLVEGDPYYGTFAGGKGYCYSYIPSFN